MALTQDERRWIEKLERGQCHLYHAVKGDAHSSGLQGRVESLEKTRVAPVMNSGWCTRWAGERCFVIATGASLTQDDVNAIRGQGRVIVVNKAYQMAPWADVLFSIDYVFWNQTSPDINKAGFAGERWTVEGCQAAQTYGLHTYPAINANIKDNGTIQELGINTERLLHAGGSGGTAINLAYAFGCNPIILLGFDMQYTNNRVHFHPDYRRSSNPDKHRFGRWRRELGDTAPWYREAGTRIINCTRSTALDCFERQPLEAVL